MLRIYDHLTNILKIKNTEILDDQDYAMYQPFLINRFLSFHSDELCILLNSTVNRWYFADKEIHRKFLITVVPKTNKTFIKYIKKPKKDKETDKSSTILTDIEEIFCKKLEISKREYKLYKDIFDITL
jgi:hypothetical protein